MPRRGPECIDEPGSPAQFPTWWAEWEWTLGAADFAAVTFRLWLAASFEPGDPRPAFFKDRDAYAAPGAGATSREFAECEPFAEGVVRDDGSMELAWPKRIVAEDGSFLPGLLGALARVRGVAGEIMG